MKKIISFVTLMAPLSVFAQTPVTDVTTLAQKLISIGNVVIYLLISLAVIFIIWNVVMALIKGSEPEAKKSALANIGYGVLGLAIILSIWGLVNILVNTFTTEKPDEGIPTLSKNNLLPVQ